MNSRAAKRRALKQIIFFRDDEESNRFDGDEKTCSDVSARRTRPIEKADYRLDSLNVFDFQIVVFNLKVYLVFKSSHKKLSQHLF